MADAAQQLVDYLDESDIGSAVDAHVRAQLKELSPEQQQEFLERLAAVNFRTVELLKSSLQSTRMLLNPNLSGKGSTAVSVKDVAVNPSQSSSLAYAEMPLWSETVRLNAKSLAAMDLDDKVDDAAMGTQSMGEVYLAQMTEGFGDDLDRLRQESTMSASAVAALADALELGKDIWEDVDKRLWCAPLTAAPIHTTHRSRT